VSLVADQSEQVPVNVQVVTPQRLRVEFQLDELQRAAGVSEEFGAAAAGHCGGCEGCGHGGCSKCSAVV
jgi:hypothetical protein